MASFGFLALVLTNCSQLGVKPSVSTKTPDIRLYVLDCGHIEFADLDAFGDQGEYTGRPGEMAVPCILIRHPVGDMLWDAGFPDAWNDLPDGLSHLGMVMTVPVTIESQLAELGLTYSDIEIFVPSHTHLDHFGNAPSLANARILMRVEEREYMQGLGQEIGVVMPETVTAEVVAALEEITGDVDVFGDGSVIVVSAPGHTPGHNVLQVDLPNSGLILFSGDLYHLVESHERRIVPRINFSKPQTLKTFSKIDQRLKQTGARLVIQHVEEHRSKLPTVPDYLD